MPMSTVQGHQGSALVAKYEGKRVLCWAGRLHRYEGYRGYKIDFIAHMSAYLGCQYLFITCASGGGQRGMVPGTLMLITDYNNLTGINPLQIVMNDPRFVSRKDFDPTACFDPELMNMARECGAGLRDHPDIKAMEGLNELQKHLFEGSYFWITGPTYESKVECDLLTQFGMDAVGMSTVPDFLAGAAIGLKTLGIAMVTDVMDRLEPLDHLTVLKNAERAVPVLKVLLLEMIKRVPLRPEIRAAIDSHINYQGDPSAIEEYPLVQPRQLLPPPTEQIKEAAAAVRKAMSQLEIHDFDSCCLFLDQLSYPEAAKHYERCWKVPLGTLPNMPLYTSSARHGCFAVGRLAATGAACLSVCGVGLEGFNNIESYFLARVLKELGIPIVYSLIRSEWVLHGEPAVLPTSGVFYRGFMSSVDPEARGKDSSREQVMIDKIIRRLSPSAYPDPVLFGLEGPVQPTQTELLTAAKMRAKVYSTCPLYSSVL